MHGGGWACEGIIVNITLRDFENPLESEAPTHSSTSLDQTHVQYRVNYLLYQATFWFVFLVLLDVFKVQWDTRRWATSHLTDRIEAFPHVQMQATMYFGTLTYQVIPQNKLLYHSELLPVISQGACFF